MTCAARLLPLGLGAALLAPALGRAADPCAAAPPAASGPLGDWLAAGCYKRPGAIHDQHERRKTGPTPATAPHGRVTVYYSASVVAWLRRGRPAGQLADGAWMVKEMFEWDSGKPSGYAAMVKDRRGSYAGWFFWPGERLAAGCIGCHASALSELTFADLRHIDGSEGPPRAGGAPSVLAAAMHPGAASARPGAPRLLTLDEQVPAPSAQGLNLRDNPGFAQLYPAPGGPSSVVPLVPWYQGKPFGPAPAASAHFLPSQNCYGCHDAQVADAAASMVLPAERKGLFLNLSPYGEWSASLMGLSGRDPVFHAQLESEKALRPAQAAALDDTCYRCHGVAGQRQLHLDQDRPFQHQMIYADKDHPLGRYGALARDGVTCTACHHIAAEGLGQERSYTGQFQLTAPADVVGPYSDAVKAEPMRQALGLVPRGAAHLSRSALCGSCHTVILPAVPRGHGGALADPALAQAHEQTTYLEWRNSAYQDERRPGASARSCQSCHMPSDIETGRGRVALRSKIANIEEYLPNVPSSLPAADITLAPRQPYRRHTLTGINLFVMQMFAQYPNVLGIARRDPFSSGPAFLSSLKLAQREALALARDSTARVSWSAAPRLQDGLWSATVRVSNLAGHKFPSGVGFRRAFLEFQVLDAAGKVLWASGATNELGVLLGADGKALPAEFASDPARLQPHHRRITSPDQVQVYEERHVDDRGALTTSFLGLFRLAKDTRLLPLGWSRGPETGFMQPLGVAGEPVYADGQSFDEVSYAVPAAAVPAAAAVQATLYYQALPPYYLMDRFRQGSGAETKRLYVLAGGLDTSAELRQWKLKVAGTGPLPLP